VQDGPTRYQYNLKSTSVLICTATGWPLSFAGSNLHLPTASTAFSSNPLPTERTTRMLKSMIHRLRLH